MWPFNSEDDCTGGHVWGNEEFIDEWKITPLLRSGDMKQVWKRYEYECLAENCDKTKQKWDSEGTFTGDEFLKALISATAEDGDVL